MKVKSTNVGKDTLLPIPSSMLGFQNRLGQFIKPKQLTKTIELVSKVNISGSYSYVWYPKNCSKK